MTQKWALSGDLAPAFILLACVLSALWLALLGVELFRGRKKPGALGIAVTGALAMTALLLAILRPVTIASRGTTVGSRVVVLFDGSRSMDLAGDSGTRRATGLEAVAALQKRATDVRLGVLRFGDGAPVLQTPAADGSGRPANAADPPFRPSARSDLGAALEALAQASDERPRALVVVSDGRLDRPAAEGAGAAARAAMGGLDIPVHTVAVAEKAPRDASVRAVHIAGAAVAHQPLALRVEIGCTGGLACDDVPVTVRELHESGEPRSLAQGTAHLEGGSGTIELQATLDRAGTRILEISIKSPSGDEIPENDTRYIATTVTRDRVRVLHVAGRPTYDVRALRMWLKSDASIDLVAFFILRTPDDDVNAAQDELALIPFPVDELFSQHLSSFDAVVLQDFNARPYGLEKYLPTLARYVNNGGGLIMVGGPDAFITGHYAGSALADVLPVELQIPAGDNPVDLGTFVPHLTDVGRAAPVLAPLRGLIGDTLPEMPGTNVVGEPRHGTTVLLEHPTRKTRKGNPMPVLALGEKGSGRTIALTVDGSHKLLFSTFAAESAAGRAHGAFWDALLGWLMKDPRFEPAVLDVVGGCIAGEPTTLVLRPLPGQRGEASVKIVRLGGGSPVRTVEVPVPGDGHPVEIPVGALAAGGYSVSAEIGEGTEKGAAARRDFACEKGGDEWADPRPDIERLRAISQATGGTFVQARDIDSLPLPAATEVAAERRVTAILPPWAWTLAAAALLGVHWILRRQKGLV